MWYEDDEDNESSWKAYSFACRKNITPQFVASLKEGERLAVEEANRDNKIFTLSVGGDQIIWKWDHGVLVPVSSHETGWREKPDGTREEVYYYVGWGWMNLDERFEERQKYPRTAP